MLPSLRLLSLQHVTVETGVPKRSLDDDEPESPRDPLPAIPSDFGSDVLEYFDGVGRWQASHRSYTKKYDNIVNVFLSLRDERKELLKTIMFGTDVFVFQSLGPSAGSSVSVSRFDSESVLLTTPNAFGEQWPPLVTTAGQMRSTVDATFDWKSPGSIITCGSSNCFFASVDVSADTEPNQSIRALIYNSFPASTSKPTTVAVRAPRLNMYVDERRNVVFDKRNERFDSLVAEFDELLLTLEMARISITPPVYGAIPVQYYDRAKDDRFPIQTSFLYFTEAGWTELENFIRENANGAIDMFTLGDAIVTCCENAAAANVVLTDVKTRNMVVKQLQTLRDNGDLSNGWLDIVEDAISALVDDDIGWLHIIGRAPQTITIFTDEGFVYGSVSDQPFPNRLGDTKGDVESALLKLIKDSKYPIHPDTHQVYDVRMIDFGSAHSVKLNQFPFDKTTGRCIFFINALLLLNYAKTVQHRRHAFRALALEAVASWRHMKVSQFKGFCDFLSVDKWYAEQFLTNARDKFTLEARFDSLQSITTIEELYIRLATMFYVNLKNYGKDEFVLPNYHTATGDKSYVDTLVNKIAQSWGLEKPEIDRFVKAMRERPPL